MLWYFFQNLLPQNMHLLQVFCVLYWGEFQSSIIIYHSSKNMTSHDSKQNIQEMEQGQKDFGIMSSIKTIHRKIINNDLITQIDLFSIPVKLNLNGKEVYQTFFGGLIHLMLILICLSLTYTIIYPDGVKFNSEITQTKIAKDYGDTGQTLFDHTKQPIGFKGLKKNGTKIIPANLTGLATFYAYQMNSDNTSVPLQVSNVCDDGFQFCIKTSEINKNAKIYGRPSNINSFSTFIQYEIVWCNSSVNATICPLATNYFVEASYSNFYKEKGGKITEYKIKNNLLIGSLRYDYNVTRQIYSSNNKFFGHMSNIFSFEIQSYRFSEFPKRFTITSTSLRTPGSYTGIKFVQVRNMPLGDTLLIKENFDDFGETILFFLSVKETFYFIIFIIFIRQYNKNSGYLEIGDSLYYIDDPKTKKKYNFKKGYEVFLACMLHNHFLSKFCNFIFAKFGKTTHDYLPNKSICAISLINKAEELLQQNVFYGNLNDLNMMEGQAPKKVPLILNKEQEQEEEVQELSYFPFLPKEDEVKRKEKEIKRQAFEQFCEANEYASAKRKNHVYTILTNNKMKYILAHEMQKAFKSFVKNFRIQKSDDIYQQIDEDQPSEIKVAIHDSSQNAMSAENLMRK